MITWIDLGNSIWLVAFVVVMSSIIFAPFYLIVYTLCKLRLNSMRRRSTILWGSLGGLPLGFTGMIAGFLTGSSRSPAVSAVVPAILTFVGLVVVYIIGKGRLRAILADFSVFIFSANLLAGAVLGSASRDRYDDQVASIEARKAEADREFKVRLYCKGLGLIPDVSKPCPLGSAEKNQDSQRSAQ